MRLREFLVDWLTASRYVRWLEARYAEQRQDFTVRLGEKDARIEQLRTELAGLRIECDRMRAVLMPYGSPAGAAYAHRWDAREKPAAVPIFDGPDEWQAELNRTYKEKSDEIREQ